MKDMDTVLGEWFGSWKRDAIHSGGVSLVELRANAQDYPIAIDALYDMPVRELKACADMYWRCQSGAVSTGGTIGDTFLACAHAYLCGELVARVDRFCHKLNVLANDWLDMPNSASIYVLRENPHRMPPHTDEEVWVNENPQDIANRYWYDINGRTERVMLYRGVYLALDPVSIEIQNEQGIVWP